MSRFVFIILFFGVVAATSAQTYQEGFETGSTHSLEGWLTPENSPLPQSVTLHYLGYGCWCTSTGGVSVGTGAGTDGSQGVRTSANTEGYNLLSPRFEMTEDKEYTLRFQYDKQNAQAAEIRVEIDVPDAEEGNYELLEVIDITGQPNSWQTFTLEYEAAQSGTARFRFVFNNLAGGQRIYFDNFSIEPVVFSDSPCNPTLPPEIRFVLPPDTEIPENQTTPIEVSLYRLGFISQNSNVNLIYSGGAALPQIDFEWLQTLPFALTFTSSSNQQRVDVFKTIPDELDEAPESIILQIETVNNALIQTDNLLTLNIVDEEVTEPLIAVPDVYVVREDNPLSINAPGVLGNDFGQNLTANLVQNPLNGTLQLNSDGSFMYQPNAEFSGVDAFEYTLASELPSVRVQITVLEVNDAPVFLNFTENLNLLQTDPTRTLDFQLNAGASNETNQTLSLAIEVENEEILTDWEWDLENATDVSLSITPDVEKSGEVVFRFLLTDNGGTQNGGINQSTALLTVNIEEVEEPLPNQILLPNTFTPNNDNQNDRFVLRSGNVASVALSIFDKWGKAVFQTNDVTEATQTGWDGGEHPNGMYAWRVRVQFLDGETQQAQGKIYLVR